MVYAKDVGIERVAVRIQLAVSAANVWVELQEGRPQGLNMAKIVQRVLQRHMIWRDDVHQLQHICLVATIAQHRAQLLELHLSVELVPWLEPHQHPHVVFAASMKQGWCRLQLGEADFAAVKYLLCAKLLRQRRRAAL